MKKEILLVFAILFTLTSYSQIVFEKGYLINNAGDRVECLIKNEDWNSNPTKFDYKKTENSDVKTATIEDTKEFGVYNASKYQRFTVDIDRSSSTELNMSDQQNPIFNEEKLFLKVLIEGKADLYEYTDGNLKRYFYRKDGFDVKQLVYKKYKVKPAEDEPYSTQKIAINNTYKQQLWNNLKCPSISIAEIKKLEYNKSSLLSFFVTYNECHDQKFVNYEDKPKRDLFNLNIRPGVNFSSMFIERYGQFTTSGFEFEDQVGFRFGVEAEFIMGFNKNKWAIIVEPTYQYFKGETEFTITSLKLDYKSLELPVGLRYYMFLNDQSKFFLNAQFVYDVSLNSSLENNISNDLDVNAQLNFAFGLGYKYNDKFSLEARYFTPRNILSDYTAWHSDYKVFSVILGYTLF